MSQQHSEGLEANLGSGRTSFANLDGGAMIVSANILAGGGRVTINPERSTAFDRWPFMKTRDEESLHDKISDKVREGMDPKDRTDLDKQQNEYEKAFKAWSAMAGAGLNPPELDDYLLVKEQVRKVSEVERGITHTVLVGLTQDEKCKLAHESNPLGPGFAPKPMSDEVVKRIREATRKHLAK